MNKLLKNIFFVLVCLSLTAAFWVAKDLLFPFVTTKAFFFRIAIEAAFPFYLYLIVSESKLRPQFKNPLTLSVSAFLVINIISSFTGVSVVRSLWGNFERMGGAYYLTNLVALYFYVLALGQMQGLYFKRFLKVLLFVSFVLVGNGIFGWLGLPTFVQDPSLPGRVSSTLGNPIYLGSFLIIPMFLSLFFALQAEGKWRKAGYCILALLFLAGIFLSGTRGAVVGVVAGSFIASLLYIALNKSQKLRNYGLMSVGIFIALAVALFIFSDKLPQGSTIQRLVKLKDSNTEARLLQWKIALTGYKDRPLFGTGPENYYIIANKYYNPEIYKYDRSWFDKPHNYLLEILVTNGLAGFLAYAAILIFMVMALFRGFRAGLYGLGEFCILLAALLVYQIQNLTVFDTVPASLMFYSFAGFTGYIWGIGSLGLKKEKASRPLNANFNQAFAWAVLAVSLVVMAYAVYATNYIPMVIAKNVNYGYAYSTVDPVKANDYFNKAMSLPFNFDKTETGGKFADFATSFSRSASEANRSLAATVLENSISYMQRALAAQPDNPILWQRVSVLYLYKGLQAGSIGSVDIRSEQAVNKAIALAPKREEVYLALAQLHGIKGNLEEAKKVLLEAIALFPTDQGAKAQLSTIYRVDGKLDLAAQFMEKAFEQGYGFGSYGEVKWLIDYYSQAKQFDKAISLMQQAQKVEPSNLQIFIDLAKLYAAAGQTDAAKTLAQSIMNFDPSKKGEMQALIDSLPKTASASTTSASKKK